MNPSGILMLKLKSKPLTGQMKLSGHMSKELTGHSAGKNHIVIHPGSMNHFISMDLMVTMRVLHGNSPER